MGKTLNSQLLDLKKHIGKVSKEATNPFFKSKYMDLPTLLEHVEPLLQERDLLLTQPLNENNVSTVITDVESGNCVTSSLTIPSLTDPQKIGSCITYFRRYTLKSLLGIQEEDDDGNRASKNNVKPKLDNVKLEGCEYWKSKEIAAVIRNYDLTDEQLNILLK